MYAPYLEPCYPQSNCFQRDYDCQAHLCVLFIQVGVERGTRHGADLTVLADRQLAVINNHVSVRVLVMVQVTLQNTK